MKQFKYIENNEQFGIDYDFKHIRKKFKSLGIPSDVWTPEHMPTHCFWNAIMSERSLGKTTNCLLWGMCMNWEYGTVIQYVRSKEDQIMPKYSSKLFETILKFGYVEKVTDGLWNTVIRKGREYYYAKENEDGQIELICDKAFIHLLSVDQNMNYKSTYNAPLGDLIIFDEFIGKFYPLDEFVYFCDLIATIKRKRRNVHVFMLSNTIDRESEYFNELEIYEDVQLLKKGENVVTATSKGTKVYVEIAGNKEFTKEKSFDLINFFGFKNPKLSAITGADWATYQYPHIPSGDYKSLSHAMHLLNNGRLYELEIVEHENIGVCIYVHRANKLYDDSIVYTITDILDSRYRYGTGFTKMDMYIWKKLYNRHKFFYTNNTCGSAVENYINNVKYL